MTKIRVARRGVVHETRSVGQRDHILHNYRRGIEHAPRDGVIRKRGAHDIPINRRRRGWIEDLIEADVLAQIGVAGGTQRCAVDSEAGAGRSAPNLARVRP